MSDRSKQNVPVRRAEATPSLSASGPWPCGTVDADVHTRPTVSGVPPARTRPTTGEYSDYESQAVPLMEVAPPSQPFGQSRLKVVTISPSTHSVPRLRIGPDGELQRDPYLGCTIDGRYQVEAVVGEGGMGVVYGCRHKMIGRKVALKVLRAGLARDKELVERFLNEAKTASAVGNPHIIDIIDFGELADGATYFAMEFLDGVPLSSELSGNRALPMQRLLHIATQLAEGLSAAHHIGIVHRDLKPDNIYLVQRGRETDFVKILDFGIAKVSSSTEGKLTRAGAVIGTPHYMSPEQAAGERIDARADIYSLGVILYECVTGQVPFDADNFMGVLTQHMYKPPPPLPAHSASGEELPHGLGAVILKCLSKLPEERYPTMDALLVELRALQHGREPDAVSEMRTRESSAPSAERGAPRLHALSIRPKRLPRKRYLAAASLLAATAIALVQHGASPQPPLMRAAPAETVAYAAQAATPRTPAPAPKPSEELAVIRQVALAVEPLDAHLYHGESDLGTSPVILEIEEGKTFELEIRKPGYKPRTLQLDGTEPKISVTLEKAPRARATARGKAAATAPAGASRPRPATKPNGQAEIVNPWD